MNHLPICGVGAKTSSARSATFVVTATSERLAKLRRSGMAPVHFRHWRSQNGHMPLLRSLVGSATLEPINMALLTELVPAPPPPLWRVQGARKAMGLTAHAKVLVPAALG